MCWQACDAHPCHAVRTVQIQVHAALCSLQEAPSRPQLLGTFTTHPSICTLATRPLYAVGTSAMRTNGTPSDPLHSECQHACSSGPVFMRSTQHAPAYLPRSLARRCMSQHHPCKTYRARCSATTASTACPHRFCLHSVQSITASASCVMHVDSQHHHQHLARLVWIQLPPAHCRPLAAAQPCPCCGSTAQSTTCNSHSSCNP